MNNSTANYLGCQRGTVFIVKSVKYNLKRTHQMSAQQNTRNK